MMDDDSFFELLSRFQSRRIDDQRCSFRVPDGPTPTTQRANVAHRRQSDSVAAHRNKMGESFWHICEISFKETVFVAEIFKNF